MTEDMKIEKINPAKFSLKDIKVINVEEEAVFNEIKNKIPENGLFIFSDKTSKGSILNIIGYTINSGIKIIYYKYSSGKINLIPVFCDFINLNLEKNQFAVFDEILFGATLIITPDEIIGDDVMNFYYSRPGY
jgi:hypothetical protein